MTASCSPAPRGCLPQMARAMPWRQPPTPPALRQKQTPATSIKWRVAWRHMPVARGFAMASTRHLQGRPSLNIQGILQGQAWQQQDIAYQDVSCKLALNSHLLVGGACSDIAPEGAAGGIVRSRQRRLEPAKWQASLRQTKPKACPPTHRSRTAWSGGHLCTC